MKFIKKYLNLTRLMRNTLIKGFIKSLLLIFSCGFLNFANAALNLELTQANDNAIPIAILPFKLPSNQNLPTDIKQIITNDLKNSGEFNLFNNDSLTSASYTINDVDFSFWQEKNIDNVLVGTIETINGSTYKITVNLLNSYGENKNDKIIFTKSLIVNKNQLRHLAHTIANDVYQKLLGVTGVFTTKIAYVKVKREETPYYRQAKYFLQIADYDGYNPQTVLTSSEPIMSPAWASDGRRIAYVSFENHHTGIYISDIYTGKRSLITLFNGINGAPKFSHDGKKLLVSLSVDDANPKIYAIDLENKHATKLTKDFSADTEPFWGANNNEIFFTSNRSGNLQIYKLNLASGEITRLTFEGGYNAKASLTNDNKKLVLLHQDTNGYDVAVNNLETSDMTILTNSGNAQSPSLAPNGKIIVYSDNYGNHGSLSFVTLDGKVKVDLPNNDGEISEPSWGP